MAQTISEDVSRRLEAFVTTATNIFMAKGYRRTKMSDITGALGLSEGAIYRYFEGKEALFNVVIRSASDDGCCAAVAEVPVPNPAPGATLAFLREAIAERARFDSLERALGRKRRPMDPRAELEKIVREIYGTTQRFRTGLRLVERCSLDWPELAQIWFGDTRQRLIDNLARYLEDRARRGCLRPVRDPYATGWLILETVAAFAAHRHHDPYPQPIDDPLAEDTVVDTLVNAHALPAP